MVLNRDNIELANIAAIQLFGVKLNKCTSSIKLRAIQRFIKNSQQWN